MRPSCNQRRRTGREWTQPSPKRHGGQAANEREFKNRLIRVYSGAFAPGEILGESETKCSSWAVVGLRDELASVVPDNRAADRKAQTHAIAFRRVKRLKD